MAKPEISPHNVLCPPMTGGWADHATRSNVIDKVMFAPDLIHLLPFCIPVEPAMCGLCTAVVGIGGTRFDTHNEVRIPRNVNTRHGRTPRIGP